MLERRCHSTSGDVPRRQTIADAAGTLGQSRPQRLAADDLTEHSGQLRDIPRRHEYSGIRRHKFRNRTRRRADNRQSSPKRLGDDHPVAFMKCRQHEYVGAVVFPVELRLMQIAGERHPIRKAVLREQSTHTIRGLWIAIKAADARQMPGLVGNARQCFD